MTTIFDLPDDIFNIFILDYLGLKDVKNISLTCKLLNINNMVSGIVATTIEYAKKGWNFCIKTGHLESLKLLSRSDIKQPFHYDSANAEYYNNVKKTLEEATKLEFMQLVNNPYNIELDATTYLRCANCDYLDFTIESIVKSNDHAETNHYNKAYYKAYKKMDIHADNNFIFHCQRASKNIPNSIWLYTNCNVDITTDYELTFYLACCYGYIDIMQWLYNTGYNLHLAMELACNRNRVELAKKLHARCLESNIIIDFPTSRIFKPRKENLEATNWIFETTKKEYPNLTTTELFKKLCNIHRNNDTNSLPYAIDVYFRQCCIKQEHEIVKWFCDRCDEYKCIVDGNKIIGCIINGYQYDDKQHIDN